MTNIALGKLPLEKDIWTDANLATDGDYTNYTGTTGFAHATHPAEFTIDLEESTIINNIRFLIWDGLGDRNIQDSRTYRFSLSISNDDINYTQVYTNQNEEGGNGWFSFSFLNLTSIRYVKLNCTYNSANEKFHIVEFEVHTSTPIKVPSNNIKEFHLNSGLIGYNQVRTIIDDAINEKTIFINELNTKAEKIRKAEERINESLKVVDLIGKSKTFNDESADNKTRANYWLLVSCLIFFVFIVVMIIFMWGDCRPLTILKTSKKLEFLESHTTLMLSFHYLSKTAFLSVILYALVWSLKNYRSELHNYVVNKHKYISLVTANAIMVNPEYKDVDKKVIFKEALVTVFSHQNTGYSKEEQNSKTSVINSVLGGEKE